MDYYKLAERAVNAQNAGKKLSSQVAKLKKDTGNEQIANILTGYVVVKLYNKLSEGMLKKELGVEDAEVTQLVAAGRNLTKFDSDKGKFMLALLAANSCYGKLKVAEFGRIMRFIKDCNSSDYDDTDFEDLEETRGISEFKAALLSIPSTVNVKCRDCGKEFRLSDIDIHNYTCKECGLKLGRLYKQRFKERVEGKPQTEIMHTRDSEQATDQQSETVKNNTKQTKSEKIQASNVNRLTQMMRDYNDMCEGIIRLDKTPEEISKILDNLDVVNRMLFREVQEFGK